MANESGYRIACTNVPGCKLLYAQILPNGALTPTLGENAGKVITSVARTGVGTIVVTLSDTYLAAGAFPALQLAVPANSAVQTTSIFPATTRLITLTTVTAGVAADIAAAAGNIINLLILARDSSAQ